MYICMLLYMYIHSHLAIATLYKGGFMNTEPYILDLSITLLLDVAEKNIPDVFEKSVFSGKEEQRKVRDIIFPKETNRALDDLYKKKWEL